MTVGEVLTPEYVAARWPRVFHMAEAGSWDSIHRHGLRSTTSLLDLYEVEEPSRAAIETRRRPESVKIHHPVHGKALIRDNKPINETVLRRTLVGISEPDWYRTLNGRVIFWLSEDRLHRLRNAPPYRERPHDILVIDTKRLLAAHAHHVELSPINSGAVHPGANYPRGADTFKRIADYPWSGRKRVAASEPIVELTVPYAVRDISKLVLDVTTR